MTGSSILPAYSTFHLLLPALTPLDLLLAFGLVSGSALLGALFFPRNLIVFLMCLEVVLVAIAFAFIAVSLLFAGSSGLVFGYLLLVVAGAESALALALLTSYFFVEQHIQSEFVARLKG
jgi:NADH:ubiquinone oxidoreductase subunit K